jgi:hypothetical protein
MTDENQTGSGSDPKPGWVPSPNTVWTAVGGVVAVITIRVCHAFGVDFAAGDEASISAGAALLLGYLHSAGRI